MKYTNTYFIPDYCEMIYKIFLSPTYIETDTETQKELLEKLNSGHIISSTIETGYMENIIPWDSVKDNKKFLKQLLDLTEYNLKSNSLVFKGISPFLIKHTVAIRMLIWYLKEQKTLILKYYNELKRSN